MTMQRIKGILYGSLLSLLTLVPAVQAAPLGDFNNDGLSDLSSVKVNRDKNNRNTIWTVRLSNGTERVYTFGLPGDALVQGKFWGDGRLYPAIVYVSDARRPLDWYLKQPDSVGGGDFYLNYGLPGDTVPTQGDLDCDGIADLTVARDGADGYKRWYIRSSARGFQVYEELFGLNTDKAAIIDTNGDGCAEKVVLRNDYNWFAQKFLQGAFTQVQWGLPGDYPLLPQDVNGDGIPDYVIVRPSGTGQVAFVRYSNGGWESFSLPSSSAAAPFLGHFLEFNRAGFGWYERSQNLGVQLLPNRFAIHHFPFGNPANAFVRPDGTVLQPSESGRFGSTAVAPTPSSGGNSGGSTPPPANFGLNNCTHYAKFGDGRTGYKYRPSSSRGRKMMWYDYSYGEIKSPVRSFDINGNLIDNWDLFQSPESGYRARAYNRKSPGSIPAPEIIVAATTDNKIICARIEDPRREQN